MADNPDFEIRQILQCLKTNGYVFEKVRNTNEHYGYIYGCVF